MISPVLGSATAETSVLQRFVPQPLAVQPVAIVCHDFAEANLLQPLPVPAQTVSPVRVPPVVSSVVPPTAMTVGTSAGNCAPTPSSPADANIGTSMSYAGANASYEPWSR